MCGQGKPGRVDGHLGKVSPLAEPRSSGRLAGGGGTPDAPPTPTAPAFPPPGAAPTRLPSQKRGGAPDSSLPCAPHIEGTAHCNSSTSRTDPELSLLLCSPPPSSASLHCGLHPLCSPPSTSAQEQSLTGPPPPCSTLSGLALRPRGRQGPPQPSPPSPKRVAHLSPGLSRAPPWPPPLLLPQLRGSLPSQGTGICSSGSGHLPFQPLVHPHQREVPLP